MKTFSNQVKQKTLEPTIAAISFAANLTSQKLETQMCNFFYKIRPSTRSEIIGCKDYHIYIENIAAHLNFSVEYIYPTMIQAMDVSKQYISGNTSRHFSGIVSKVLPWTHSEGQIF